jgi:hypothetical protein
MLTHLKIICSVLDKLLSNLDIVSLGQSEPEESGLSQGLKSHNLSELLNHNVSSPLEKADSQSSCVGNVTLETSVSQRIKKGAFKKPKKRGRPVKFH